MGSLSSPRDLTKPFNPLDPTELAVESSLVTDFIAEYYRTVEQRPVQPHVTPGFLTSQLPSAAPFASESVESILQDVYDKILPGLVQWQSPNFHAYYPATCSNAGLLGEMLCSGLNVVGFTWSASPAAAELEQVVVDWMGKMMGLPQGLLFSGGGGGVLQGSTCEAVVCTLAAARDRALERVGDDMFNKLVVYCSDQTHFTLKKGSKLVGIRPANVKAIKTTKNNEYGLCPTDLRDLVASDVKAGFIPIYLCGTIGTTAFGAVDPIRELGKVAREFNMWFHVDAAYAGSAFICPEFRHYMDGVELADSFSTNPHKWLLSNMDCCVLWLKFPKRVIKSLAAGGNFLEGGSETMVDYKDWQIALSRRFRAIKLWMVIKRYGYKNLISHIRSDVSMAKRFEELLLSDRRFEVVFPRKFSLVCFKLDVMKNVPEVVDEDDGELSHDSKLTRELMASVNVTGKAFLTGVRLGRIFFIRCAIGSTLTEDRHIQDLWKLIQEKAHKICIMI
uniref:Tyrosine decarboxylase n=1 Tax=Kalanchoe fedtschenkoi TaxID=63787 RepID=A0A7N0TZA9_KALFE